MSSNSNPGNPSADNETPSSVPQTTPPRIGYGHPEFQFVQHVMELQKSITRLESILEHVQKTVDGTQSKVASFEKIMYAAGVVLAVALVVGGWMVNTAKDVALMYVQTTLENQTTTENKSAQPATPKNKHQ